MSLFVPKYHLVRIELKPSHISLNISDVCGDLSCTDIEVYPNDGALLAKVYGKDKKRVEDTIRNAIKSKNIPLDISSIHVVGYIRE